MSLKQIEQVRPRVAKGIANELIRIRSYLSMTEGNAEAVELLRGEQGDRILHELTEKLLRHIGYQAPVGSHELRTVKGLFGIGGA